MTMNKQEQWRIEALDRWSETPLDNANDFIEGYLAACKKRDEEFIAEHEDKVAIIKFQDKEIAQLKAELENSKRETWISINVSADYMQEIEELKEQLKLERDCVDFYADFTSWESDNTHDPDKFVIDESDRHWIKDAGEIGGKRARSVQAQRRVL